MRAQAGWRVPLGAILVLAGAGALTCAFGPFFYDPDASPTWLGALGFLLPVGVALLLGAPVKAGRSGR